MKNWLPIGVVLVLIATSGGTFMACSPGAVQVPAVDTTSSCGYPAHFVDYIDFEVEYESLDSLPPDISSKLRRHLVSRLGHRFFNSLSFQTASYMDPALVPDVVEFNETLNRQYVAYVILFGAPFVNGQGEDYCAGVHLDETGKIVQDVGLPNVGQAPQKAQVISSDQAIEIARQHRMGGDNMWLELLYAPSLDSMVWEVSESTKEEESYIHFTTCSIEAHTGKFLGWQTGQIRF